MYVRVVEARIINEMCKRDHEKLLVQFDDVFE